MLSTQALSFTRQTGSLFKNINISLNPGEILQVSGANGSGKTTLLRVLAGFLKPSSGDIQYQQASANARYQANIAYLGHTNGIKSALTVQENLVSHCTLMGVQQIPDFTLPARGRGAGGEGLINELLESLHLRSSQNKFAYQLSAGQQRKLALAKIILSQKPIWLLDEPLTALDQASIEAFMQYLDRHLTNHGIAIIATHQPLTIRTKSIQHLSLSERQTT